MFPMPIVSCADDALRAEEARLCLVAARNPELHQRYSFALRSDSFGDSPWGYEVLDSAELNERLACLTSLPTTTRVDVMAFEKIDGAMHQVGRLVFNREATWMVYRFDAQAGFWVNF
jgi:hypothetical protein